MPTAVAPLLRVPFHEEVAGEWAARIKGNIGGGGGGGGGKMSIRMICFNTYSIYNSTYSYDDPTVNENILVPSNFLQLHV